MKEIKTTHWLMAILLAMLAVAIWQSVRTVYEPKDGGSNTWSAAVEQLMERGR